MSDRIIYNLPVRLLDSGSNPYMQMASTLRSIDGQALMYLKSETGDNIPVTAVVTVLDGIIGKKEIASLINSRLIADPAYYRFRSLVTDSGYFKELKHFDANHVLKVIQTKHQQSADDIDDIFHILAENLSTHIHECHNYTFNKKDELPLWRGHILQFNDLDKTVFYLKCHHVICDGMSLSKVFLSLADNFKEINKKQADSILTSARYKQYQKRWKRPLLYILFVIINCVHWLFDVFSLFYCHYERASIIKPKESNGKKSYFVLYNIAINAIDKVRKSAPYSDKKVTINDYLLAIISEALSRFLSENGAKSNEIIKAGTVISMNGRDPLSLATKTDIDCCVGVSQLNIPISLEFNIEDKVKYIKRQMDKIKAKQYAMFSAILLQFTGFLPRFMIPFLMKLQRASLLVSNVRGPIDSLYLNGHKILSVSGVVPNSAGISLSFCITGYDGNCSISLLSDYNIIGSKTSHKILQYVADVLAEQGIGCVENRNGVQHPQFSHRDNGYKKLHFTKSRGVNQTALTIFLGIVLICCLMLLFLYHDGFVLT